MDHPILYSRRMIVANHAGRKSQTRRVVTRQNSRVDGYIAPVWKWDSLDFSHSWIDGTERQYLHVPTFDGQSTHRVWPMWMVTDRLWVREAWATISTRDRIKPIDLPIDRSAIWYAATDAPNEWIGRHRASIHMPRWASRTYCLVTSVRVQHIHEISEADAIDEGVERTDWSYSCTPYRNYMRADPGPGQNFASARRSYMSLWQLLNGVESWDANPLVWVIDYIHEGFSD